MVSKPSKLQFPRFWDSTFLLNYHSPRQSSPSVSPFGGFCSELLRGLEPLSVEKEALPLQSSLARWYRPRHKHTPAWRQQLSPTRASLRFAEDFSSPHSLCATRPSPQKGLPCPALQFGFQASSRSAQGVEGCVGLTHLCICSGALS